MLPSSGAEQFSASGPEQAVPGLLEDDAHSPHVQAQPAPFRRHVRRVEAGGARLRAQVPQLFGWQAVVLVHKRLQGGSPRRERSGDIFAEIHQSGRD